jgi:ATP-binding cassette subfamily B protein
MNGSFFDFDDSRVRHAAALYAVAAVFAAIPIACIAYVLLAAASAPPPRVIVLAIAGFVAVAAVMQTPIATAGSRFFRGSLDERARALRVAVVEHLRLVPARTLATIEAGKVLAAVTLGLDQAMAAIGAAFDAAFSGTLRAIACLVIVALVDWRIALISLAFLPVVLIYARLSRGINAKATPRMVRAQTEGAARFYEYIESIALLRAFGFTAERLRRLTTAIAELNHKAFENTVAPMTFGVVALFFLEFGFAIALAVGVEVGAASSGVRYVLAFTIALAYFQALFEALDSFLRLRDAAAPLGAIAWLLDLPAGEDRTAGLPERHDLELDNVSFIYDRGPVLQSLRERFPERAVTAVVGASGAGKSALAGVLSGAWDASEGAVRIGGVDLSTLSREARARAVTVVFQDTHLFEESIANNIAAGRRDATRQEILDAAKIAGCDGFALRLPDGYDTVIRSGGTNLSLGERQRIAVARALLSQAPVVVLDECTASLDAEAERAVHDAIAALAERKTVVLITHRLGTVRRAQRILVLANGAIAESGTHEQLLARHGEYARLWAAHERTNHWKVAG